MPINPAGAQPRVYPWRFELELIDYLAANGIGVKRSSLWHERLPTTPTQVTLVVGDQTPVNFIDPASHPGFRILCRDTVETSAAYLAQVIFGLLHHRVLRLPSCDVFVTANHEPGRYYDDHQHPIFFVGFSTVAVTVPGA